MMPLIHNRLILILLKLVIMESINSIRCIASYKLIRIKQKIAFEAAKQRISILELFVKAIYKTYKQRNCLSQFDI